MRIKTTDSVLLEWTYVEDESIEDDMNDLKNLLCKKIEFFQKNHSLNQTEAAKLMGISQPRLNDILKRKHQKYTLDRLITILMKIRKKVKISTVG